MKHGRKMIAPIIITIIFVSYFLISGISFLIYPETFSVATALIALVALLLSGVMISVLISRIKEIRSGEEDDLSQY